MKKNTTEWCEYCKDRTADLLNEYGERLCTPCFNKTLVRDIADCEPTYSHADGGAFIFVAFNEGWCKNGPGVQSEPLTLDQARIFMSILAEAIACAEKMTVEYGS